MSVCCHKFKLCEDRPGYEVCQCGTYHSICAPPPEEIYTANYWTPEHGHSTFQDQIYNVDNHKENGKTKVEAVLEAISVKNRNYALEIGCAPGILLRRLLSDARFYSVIGIEMQESWDEEMHTVCGGDPVIMYGTFPQVTRNKPEGKMDLVVACDVFEHSHEPWHFLLECHRILRPGGQLILMLPLAFDDIPERMFAPLEHVYIHSLGNLVAMMAQAGLMMDHLGRWCPGHDIVSAKKAALPEGRLSAA